MNVTYDQRLTDYMQRKGFSSIVVESLNPCGCCADTTELYTRFARPAEADRLRPNAWKVLPAPTQGAPDILLMTRGLELDEEVHLGLRSFLGAKDIAVKGIHAWRL